jgi:hypothetical protein
MRFRGGGIGHKATQERTQAFSCKSTDIMRDLDRADWENVGSDAGEDSEEEGDNDDEVDEEEDNVDEPLEEDDDLDELELGGEDGEEPWEMDEVEAEGYGQL